MKSIQWQGLLVLHVVLTIISGIIENTTMGAGEISTIQKLMTLPQVTETGNVIGVFTAYFSMSWDYIKNLYTVFFFNYAFFQGQWLIVKYILFLPISVGLIMTLIFALLGRRGA